MFKQLSISILAVVALFSFVASPITKAQEDYVSSDTNLFSGWSLFSSLPSSETSQTFVSETEINCLFCNNESVSFGYNNSYSQFGEINSSFTEQYNETSSFTESYQDGYSQNKGNTNVCYIYSQLPFGGKRYHSKVDAKCYTGYANIAESNCKSMTGFSCTQQEYKD
jgi:hypothetical protein